MESQQIEFTAPAGQRLDHILMQQMGEGMSRTQVQALIKEGHVAVDGQPLLRPGVKLRGGEAVLVTIPPREDDDETVRPEDIALNEFYDDEHIAVIDKPAGMVVHPGVGGETGTLVAAALHRWPEIALMPGSARRPGIVHRLDKDTSGLIVIAKHEAARLTLLEQFQARTVEKVYLALLEKRPETNSGRIEAPIARDPRHRKRMAVMRNGRPAVTEFSVLDDDFNGGQAFVRIRLLTGRTHQIRVHMAFIGCPLVGDPVYGFRKQRVRLKRQFLHAAELAFDHPLTGERLSFESPLPAGLEQVMAKLR